MKLYYLKNLKFNVDESSDTVLEAKKGSQVAEFQRERNLKIIAADEKDLVTKFSKFVRQELGPFKVPLNRFTATFVESCDYGNNVFSGNNGITSSSLTDIRLKD